MMLSFSSTISTLADELFRVMRPEGWSLFTQGTLVLPDAAKHGRAAGFPGDLIVPIFRQVRLSFSRHHLALSGAR